MLSRAPLAVSIVLALAIAIQATALTGALLSEIATVSATGTAVTMRPRGGQRGLRSVTAFKAIGAAHLFGEADVLMTARTRVGREPLVLTGIIATDDPADGYAILGPSVAATRVSHAGSQALPGVLLLDVYPTRVVLLRGGQRVILMLPHGPLASRTGSAQFAGARTARAAEPIADEVDADDGARMQEFQPPPMSDAATIIRAFALRPVSRDGERGVRIMSTGLNSRTLSDLGLAPGDIITAINGMPVGSPGTPDLGKALQQGAASLVVDRNGEQTSITIDPGSAASAAQAYGQVDSDN